MCWCCSQLQIWMRQVFPLPSPSMQSGLWAHKAEFLVGRLADNSAWQEPSCGLCFQSSEHLTRWPAGGGAGWNPSLSLLFKGSRLDLLRAQLGTWKVTLKWSRRHRHIVSASGFQPTLWNFHNLTLCHNYSVLALYCHQPKGVFISVICHCKCYVYNHGSVSPKQQKEEQE